MIDPGSTTLVGPEQLRAGVRNVGRRPREPIHRPSGWAYLSLLSERMVSQRTARRDLVALRGFRRIQVGQEGPGPENSLFSRIPLIGPDAVVRRAGEDRMA